MHMIRLTNEEHALAGQKMPIREDFEMHAGMNVVAAGVSAVLTMAGAAVAQDGQPEFGGEEDVSYAETLWTALNDAQLAGDGAIQAAPYEGTDPHGVVLQTLWGEIAVQDHRGLVIVKRNYGPADVTIDEVANSPAENLGSVTVMLQREDGYAPDSGNWFWAKYLPDGSLDQTPEGVMLAGRAAGCIACHSEAEGGDFVYTMDVEP